MAITQVRALSLHQNHFPNLNAVRLRSVFYGGEERLGFKLHDGELDFQKLAPIVHTSTFPTTLGP